MNILRFLQEVDRRVLYALLVLTICIPFFLPISKLKIPISTPVLNYYQQIEKLEAGDFVLLASDWAGGTRGENRPQTEATVRHMMRKRVRFAILSFDPGARPLVQSLVESLTVEMAKEIGYKYEYGKDWVNFGYRVDPQNFLKGFVQDVPGVVSKDIFDIPVATMPVMRGIHTARDFDLIVSVAPSAIFQTYIQFVAGPKNVPMILAPTAVMATEAFNYLDSGQLKGMLPGLQAAAEYEALLGYSGKATRAALTLSFAHILIISFIILGNVAMILERRQRRSMGLEG